MHLSFSTTLQGYFLPTFHKYYWLGLQADDNRRWAMLDQTSLPTYSNSKYINWGVKMPGLISEPDNEVAPEICAVGNFTEMRKEQLPNRAGWADTGCLLQYPAMCRLASES